VSKGIPENRITVKGYGSAKPIEDNATAAGKAKNRRVQIVLGK
jgi:outer membrane protein OmpA-like peptidoglycan-associated protein